MLQLYEDPNIIPVFINESELEKKVFLQISRISKRVRYQMDLLHVFISILNKMTHIDVFQRIENQNFNSL